MTKKELLDEMLRGNCILFGEFTLPSGKVTNYYIDIKSVISSPRVLKLISKLVQEKTKSIEFDKIVALELWAVLIATTISLEIQKPLVILSTKENENEQIIGNIKAGDRLILIHDITTTGETVLKAIKKLENLETTIKGVIVIVDRNEGAKEKIEKKGYSFIPLLTTSEILNTQTSKSDRT